jgi:hypothetical protein
LKTILVLLLTTTSLWAQDQPRGKKKFLLVAGASVFEIAANHYDTVETEKGLRAAVAVEGNTWLVGSHPSAGALYRRDALQLGITVSPSILFYKLRQWSLFYGSASAPAGLGLGHISGGRRWAKLLKANQ